MREAVQNIEREFKRFSGEEFLPLLENFIYFIENVSSNIVSFYIGGKAYDVYFFEYLKKLEVELEKVIDNLVIYKSVLLGAGYWTILDICEDSYSKVKSFINLHKYLRVGNIKGSYLDSNQVSYVLKENESLESVARKFSKEEGWIDIAIVNKLREEDYSLQGGELLKFSVPKGVSIYNTTITRDVLGDSSGEKVNGVDINKDISFTEDDIVYLSTKETFKQAIYILSSLKKGDNPEYLENGISTKLVGGNINSLAFPSLYRDIMFTFGNDDTISFVVVKNIKLEEDILYLEYEIISKYGQVEKGFIKV